MDNINPLTIDLSKISKKDNPKIGSKAANLGELLRNKITVPQGFVLTTEAYSLFLEFNKLNNLIEVELSKIDYKNVDSIDECAKKVQDAIKESMIPLEIINEIKQKYEDLSLDNVAVRSSATAEDLPTASFAGQYDTFLNLKNLDDVLEGIKECYASAWTSRSISYRYENQISHSKVKFAVIVQGMIQATCAGVLFTVDPVFMSSSELVIESNFGLGESVVSGITSPDRFKIHRKGKALKIVDKQISCKKIAIHSISSEDKSGIEHIELNEDEGMKCSLSDNQIIELSKLGIKVERAFGNPQDIEWAIDDKNQIYLLQSRPITSLKEEIVEEIYWSRGYSDDYWNDPVTPLFFDILGDPLTKIVNMELNSIMGYKHMSSNLLKLYSGHVYFNLDVLKRKVENEIPKFMRNEDLLNYFPDDSSPYGKAFIKELPFHLLRRIVAELRIKIFDPNGSITKTAEKYYEWSGKEFEPYCDYFDSQLDILTGTGNLQSLMSLVLELEKKMIPHFRLIRYGIPVHNIGMNLMVQYLLAKFLGVKESSRYYPVLISGLDHKLTETNDEIHYLSSIIQESPEVKSLILEYDSDRLMELMASEREPNIQVFVKELERFLKKYGDRGFTREIFYPRWKEAPQYLFDILKTLVMGLEEKVDFKKLKIKTLDYRKKVEKYIENKLRSKRFGLIKWKLLSKILDFSRKYIIFREEQRFNLDRWISRNRRIYLEIGRCFTAKGILNEPMDIFFLYKKEIEKIFLNILDSEAKTIIQQRKDEFFEFEYTIPPKFLCGSREFDDTMKYTEDSTSFKGIPASHGRRTGKIRILLKIEELTTVQGGEILVVPKTDPGWTPVFSKISGLITETGGVLSHGAVVSREYGIPAVTNVPNACNLFKTGQVVTINGYTGSITIKN